MTSKIVASPARKPGEHHDYLSEIAALAVMVDVWQRVLAEHQPNADGKCGHRTCDNRGHGVPWPCTTWVAADNAATLHHGGRNGRAA